MGQKVGQVVGKETVKDPQPQQTAVFEGQQLKPQSREAALLNLQRTHGNRHVQQMLKGGVLQRKCACEQSGGSTGTCNNCQKQPLTLQRRAEGQTQVTEIPAIVHQVLNSPGQPLDTETRTFMESRFDRDFSGVRLHADPRAQASTEAVNAQAYTVGHHVVVGRGTSSYTSLQGRKLIAHELTHVVQQSSGGNMSTNAAGLEVEADRAAEAIGSGGFISVQGRANPSIQRLESPIVAKDNISKLVIDGVASSLGLNSTSFRLIESGLSGAIEGFRQQWTDGGTGKRLGGHVKDLSWRDVPAIVGGYIVGVTQGIISPITDLWSIAVIIEQIRDFGQKLVQSALTQGSSLKGELDGIYSSLTPLSNQMRNAFNFMKGHKLDILKMLLGFAGSQNGMIDKMEEVAHSWGNKGGKEIAKSLEEPWEEKKKEESKQSISQWVMQAATKPAQTLDRLGEKASEALVSSPWGKVGNKTGYALGFAVVQVALLVFSEGIGNLITEIGKGLGSLAKAGSVLGRTVENVGKFFVVGGKFIAEIEGAIGMLISKIAKPMLPIIEPILKPFGEVMERLSKFLRRLLGVAEKEGAHLSTTAVSKASGATTHASATGSKPHSVTSPTHSTKSLSHVETGTVTKPHAKPLVSKDPNVTIEAPKTSQVKLTPPKEPPISKPQADAVKFVKENPKVIEGEPGHRRAPVGKGHEIVEITDRNLPSGIGCELHSPPPHIKVPCPPGMGNVKGTNQKLELDRINKPAMGKAPFDEPLTPSERKLTLEQLRQKHILEDQIASQKQFRTASKQADMSNFKSVDKKQAGISLAEDHHIATRYSPENKKLFKDLGYRIDGDLNLIKNFEEHGQLRGWYKWSQEKKIYEYRMRGHHPEYNKWVTKQLASSVEGLTGKKAERAFKSVQKRLSSIIQKYPDILAYGPRILPPIILESMPLP